MWFDLSFDPEKTCLRLEVKSLKFIRCHLPCVAIIGLASIHDHHFGFSYIFHQITTLLKIGATKWVVSQTLGSNWAF